MAGANTGHAAPECDPLHGRRRRRQLEGEMAASGLRGGDPEVGWARILFRSVPMAGLTYHNQVERSIGQSASGKSQRRRSTGQLVQG